MAKANSPYALEKDYWDNLPVDARQWVEKYARASEFGDFKVLQELCDMAPSDQFEVIKQDIMYERDFYRRDQYTIPVNRFPRYSEHDYSWSASMREHHPKVDMRHKIDTQYSAPVTITNMKWAK